MLSAIRRRLSYANVVATLALVFAMSGSALAAKHYLINSTKQINPKVLKKLKGQNGKTGPIGPAGPKGETGTAGTPGAKGEPGAAATTLWAVVASDGTLVRHGTGTISSSEIVPGRYQVIFNREVSGCSYVATLGDTAHGVPPIGEIGVAAREGNANGVYVETLNSSGTETAESFHVAVLC